MKITFSELWYLFAIKIIDTQVARQGRRYAKKKRKKSNNRYLLYDFGVIGCTTVYNFFSHVCDILHHNFNISNIQTRIIL